MHNIYSSCSRLYKNLKKYNHTHIGLEYNELSNLQDYGQLDTIEFYPVINRDKGLQNRVEFESFPEKIYTKENADRICNRQPSSFSDTGIEIETL